MIKLLLLFTFLFSSYDTVGQYISINHKYVKLLESNHPDNLPKETYFVDFVEERQAAYFIRDTAVIAVNYSAECQVSGNKLYITDKHVYYTFEVKQ